MAVVDQDVDEHGNRAAAEEYVKYLYSREGQEIAAKCFYRPRTKEVMEKFAGRFAKVEMVTIDELGGGRR